MIPTNAPEPVWTSVDGTLSVDDAVSGVLGLFPGADRQALRCLANLMAKPAATPPLPVDPSTKALRSALNAMLTHFGMDEDEWTKPTFDQARAALASSPAVQAVPIQTQDSRHQAERLIPDVRTGQDGIHSCSYYCDRPQCVRAQRDEFRERLFENAQPPVLPDVPAQPDERKES